MEQSYAHNALRNHENEQMITRTFKMGGGFMEEPRYLRSHLRKTRELATYCGLLFQRCNKQTTEFISCYFILKLHTVFNVNVQDGRHGGATNVFFCRSATIYHNYDIIMA